MTRDEALHLLQITGDPSPQAIQHAHEAAAADLAPRIAAAPTPELRQSCESQLARLHQARDLLLSEATCSSANPSPLSLTKQLDLPARTPAPLTVGSLDSSYMPDPAIALGLTAGRILADRYEIRATWAPAAWAPSSPRSTVSATRRLPSRSCSRISCANPKALERFQNEARIASNLTHPNIVRVYDLHQTAGFTFLTMELLKGHNLRRDRRTAQAGPEVHGPRGAQHRQSTLCRTPFAHRETVHRDIKPENIWLCDDGTVKVMDFGIARLLRPSQFTSTGLALGTAYYMAPEQVHGQDVDHRADQFSLAVVLYELLTSELPQGVIKPPHRLRRSVPGVMSQRGDESPGGAAGGTTRRHGSAGPNTDPAVGKQHDHPHGGRWRRNLTVCGIDLPLLEALYPQHAPGHQARGRIDSAT